MKIDIKTKGEGGQRDYEIFYLLYIDGVEVLKTKDLSIVSVVINSKIN